MLTFLKQFDLFVVFTQSVNLQFNFKHLVSGMLATVVYTQIVFLQNQLREHYHFLCAFSRQFSKC